MRIGCAVKHTDLRPSIRVARKVAVMPLSSGSLAAGSLSLGSSSGQQPAQDPGLQQAGRSDAVAKFGAVDGVHGLELFEGPGKPADVCSWKTLMDWLKEPSARVDGHAFRLSAKSKAMFPTRVTLDCQTHDRCGASRRLKALLKARLKTSTDLKH